MCTEKPCITSMFLSSNPMRLFDAVVSLAVLYGLSNAALTGKQLLDLEDRVQRRMLRSVVGWRRSADEEWSDTMRRMNARVAFAMHQHLVPDWTQQLKQRKLTLVTKLTTQPGWPAQCMNWTPSQDLRKNFKQLPYRKPGRPMTRWDDDYRFISNLNVV